LTSLDDGNAAKGFACKTKTPSKPNGALLGPHYGRAASGSATSV
jgi:hypothetical protein